MEEIFKNYQFIFSVIGAIGSKVANIISLWPGIIENFFKNYQFTFSAIGAIGSMGAVIISLWLARQNKPKIKATFSLSSPIGSDKSLVTVSIANKGILPVFIPIGFLILRSRFGGFAQIIPPSEVSKIEPYESRIFIIGEKKELSFKLQEIIKDQFRLLRFYFLRAEVELSDGSVFVIKNGKKFIRSLCKPPIKCNSLNLI